MSNHPEPLDVDTIEARAHSATSHSFLCDSNYHFNLILQAKTDIQLLVSEVRRLREREAKLRELHAPVPIYQECGHEHEEEEPGKVFATTIGLTCNYRYDVCNACCISASAQYDDEPFLEICEEHRHRPGTPICKTREILDA